MNLYVVVLPCIVFIHQACGSQKPITAYSGQSVVLKSGADRSWNLTRVQWFIYTNTTLIASLKEGEVILYNFWRYQGRLQLNKETADLTIHNVTVGDSLTYNVDLLTSNGTRRQHKVNLTVEEILKTPEIWIKMHHSHSDQQCYISLECSAFGQSVNLSWTPDGEFNGSYISGIQNSTLLLFALFTGNRNVTFNCTACSGQQTVSSQRSVGCSGEKQKCEVCDVCGLSSCCVILILLIVVAIVSCACIKNKEKIKDVCPERIQNFIQNIRNRRNRSVSPGSCEIPAKKGAT